MGKRSKRRGHFCWCCQRVLPDERFSGRGHARHLCRECKRLGPRELAYRQAQRNIERLLDWDGRIRRKRRHEFQRFLEHSNPRVREYAERVAALDAETRREFREAQEADEALCESWDGLREEDADSKGDELIRSDPDIPF